MLSVPLPALVRAIVPASGVVSVMLLLLLRVSAPPLPVSVPVPTSGDSLSVILPIFWALAPTFSEEPVSVVSDAALNTLAVPAITEPPVTSVAPE